MPSATHKQTLTFLAPPPEYRRFYSAANANEIDWPFSLCTFIGPKH